MHLYVPQVNQDLCHWVAEDVFKFLYLYVFFGIFLYRIVQKAVSTDAGTDGHVTVS